MSLAISAGDVKKLIKLYKIMIDVSLMTIFGRIFREANNTAVVRE